jgi:hypothetical protein
VLEFVAFLLGAFTFAVACILLIGVIVGVIEGIKRGEF